MKYKSFKSFLLEKISPHETNYGTDLHNKMWFEYKTDIRKSPLFWKDDIIGEYFYITFFEHNGTHYAITFNKLDGVVDIAFNSGHFNPNTFLRIKNIEQVFYYLDQNFSFNLINKSQAQSVFSKVFYVILEGYKTYNIRSFRFKPADNSISGRLTRFYEKYFTSDGNIRRLGDDGLIFQGKENTAFLFKFKGK